MSLSWFPLYHGDYLRDTSDLSASEHGIYLLLLMAFFGRGPLPDHMSRLCRIAAGADPEEVRGILERYWHRTDAGWINRRMLSVIEEQMASHDRRVAAGKQGGQMRSSNAKAMLKQCSSNQNQNHTLPSEEKNKTHATHESAISVPEPARDPCPYAKIRELWINMLPELTRPIGVEHWTPARKAQIRARWKDQLPDLQAWEATFNLVRRSPFLMGKTDRPFKCDLFWVIKPENLLKLYEHKYG